MSLITILLGLLGLGIVVFFHELGHFLAARLVGVGVDEFSLGWGPRLVSRRMGNTTYTLSALPIGGYCRMKGENAYRQALEEGLDEFPREPGSYFGASPARRIVIALGGPLMNVVFAFLAYAVVMGIGYEVRSWDTRVVLVSEYDGGSYPADSAGVLSGDRIVALDGRSVKTFYDIQEIISMSAGRSVAAEIERDGRRLGLSLAPALDKDTGAGRVGLYPWIEPVVGSVAPAGPAAIAGLKPGDRVLSVNGAPVPHSLAVSALASSGSPTKATLGIERDGVPQELTLVLGSPEGDPLGISWVSASSRVGADGFTDALAKGAAETGRTIKATYAGIASLFRGVNLLKAVSGPARITWMVGSVAKEGLASEAPAEGLAVALGFLAMLSIGLFAMNLLPIPLLDGGSILLFLVELARRKAAKVKTVMRYQTVGVVAVAAIFLLASVGDLLFFSRK